MSEPQAYETPGEELVIRKCWSPPCENIAAFRDGAGWWWCIEHQERQMWGIDVIPKWQEIVNEIRKISTPRKGGGK